MSRQSSGSHLLGPNQPVRAYSEALEVEYLNMHRDLCILVEVPNTLASAACLCEQLEESFYTARELLEQDFGISASLARSIPNPVCNPFIVNCQAWATSDKGWGLYEEWYREEQKSFVTHGTRYQDFVNPENFWHRLRTTAYSIERALRIIQSRVAPEDLTFEVEYRPNDYFWLEDWAPDLAILEKRLDFLFFPLPDQYGLRGDPYLYCHMAQKAAAIDMPVTTREVLAIIETLFEESTGRPVQYEGDFFCETYAFGGMSSGYISTDWWRRSGLPLLKQRFEALQIRQKSID